MATKKEDEEIKRPEPQSALNPTIMGRPLFPTLERTKEMIGSAASSVMDALGSGPNPAMMAGSAGANPLVASQVPDFPQGGALINTSRFYGPPSERPDWRDPAMQWDVAKTTAQKPSMDIPLPSSPSATSVGQDLVTQPAIRDTVLPIELTQRQTKSELPQGPAYRQIQTPYGTIYATPEQAAKTRVAEIASLPADHMRLARIGEEARRNVAIRQAQQAGRTLGRANVDTTEKYFAQKQAERAALASASAEARGAGMSPESIREARRAYTSRQPSSVAGIRRDLASMMPNFNRPMAERTEFVRSPFNIPSGGPQPYGASFATPSPILDNYRLGSPMSFNFGYGV
jgi:hypothetical protein